MRRTTRPPRFSGRDPFRRGGKTNLLAAWRSAWSRVRSLLPWGSSLKFAGRTPNASGFGAPSGPPRSLLLTARTVALGAMLLLLLSSAFVATRRDSIGSQVPWPAARPLRIFDSSARNGAPSTWARARLVPVPRSWSETFWALPTFAGELAHRLAPREIGPRAAITFIALAWLPLLAWRLAAQVGGWKRPSLGLGLLLLTQGFGVSYWLGTMRAPIRKIVPSSTCRAFSFGARTIHSDGVLTPQQAIEWHRGRGFSGFAFSNNRNSEGVSGLQRANRDMILLGGGELQKPNGSARIITTQPQIPTDGSDIFKASRTAKTGDALLILPRPWREPLPLRERLLPNVDAVEAWAGSTGDENVARQARARGLAVVGSASLGAGSDCYVWGLVPSSARTPEAVLRAVKSRRVAVAYALLKDETPSNLEEKRAAARSFGAPMRAWKQSVSQLSPAERLNLRGQLLALVLALFLWGARASQVLERPQGPASAAKFLRRKRLLRRANGLAAMLLALVGTLALASSALGAGGWKDLLPASLVAPAVFAGWLALDALYLYGRSVWKRVH